jgi:hypothetical protein
MNPQQCDNGFFWQYTEARPLLAKTEAWPPYSKNAAHSLSLLFYFCNYPLPGKGQIKLTRNNCVQHYASYRGLINLSRFEVHISSIEMLTLSKRAKQKSPFQHALKKAFIHTGYSLSNLRMLED